MNAAARENRTAREWDTLIRKKSLIAFSDMDDPKKLTKGDFREDSMTMTKDSLYPVFDAAHDTNGQLLSAGDVTAKTTNG